MATPTVKFTVSFTFDHDKVQRRLSKQAQEAQKWLDDRVITDTEPYVPFLTGNTNSSVRAATVIGGGVVKYTSQDWYPSYVRRIYYWTSHNFNPTVHSKATAMWFEPAKAVHKTTWILGTKDAFRRAA